MKKCFLLGFFCLMSASALFSQEVRRITYTEMRPDGTIGRTVTVDAVFLGWRQERFTLEGNLLVTHSTIRLVGSDEWTAWELAGRQPAGTTLRHMFDEGLRQHSLHPRSSMIFPMSGVQTIRIRTTPDGRPSPMWWRDDGRAFYIFNRLYMLL